MWPLKRAKEGTMCFTTLWEKCLRRAVKLPMPAFTPGTFLRQPGVRGHRLTVLFMQIMLTVLATDGQRAGTGGPKHAGSSIQRAATQCPEFLWMVQTGKTNDELQAPSVTEYCHLLRPRLPERDVQIYGSPTQQQIPVQRRWKWP